ncbi:MAG: histidine triad nucleotide-binding protein [Actinobacteria bacterium]|nr:histidine triad nucleotide-binding protein [Actinomycetota bacterium]
MEDCIFCKVVNKEISSNIIHEGKNVVVFSDINPKAPFHFLVVPKRHVSSILEVEKLGDSEIRELVEVISLIAKKFDMDKEGFRVVTNTGRGAGQSVNHLHFHLLGGREFGWPPG